MSSINKTVVGVAAAVAVGAIAYSYMQTTKTTDMKMKWTLLDTELPATTKASDSKSDSKVDTTVIGARSSHGLSVAGNTLYMLGGEVIARNPVDSTVWARELKEGSVWAPVVAKSDECPEARVAHTQAIINGEMYIFGGRQGISMEEAPLNDLWKFSLENHVWVQLKPEGPAPEPRSFHKMVSLGTKLYVYGGCSAKGRLADLHCYDTTTNTWSFVSEPPKDMAGRGGAGFVASSDAKALFVVGGFIGDESNAVYRFDLETNQWQTVLAEGNDKLRPFSVACCVTLKDRLAFFGGEVNPSEKGHEGAGGFCRDVVVLDGQSGVPISSGVAPGPEARGWSDAAAWGGNKLVVYGGLAGSDSEPERLADTWVLEFTN